MTTNTLQAIALIVAIIICVIWGWFYFNRIAPWMRGRLGKSLGIHVASKPGFSLIRGSRLSWNAEEPVDFDKHIQILRMEILGFLFLLFLPIAVIVISAFMLMRNLGKTV